MHTPHFSTQLESNNIEFKDSRAEDGHSKLSALKWAVIDLDILWGYRHPHPSPICYFLLHLVQLHFHLYHWIEWDLINLTFTSPHIQKRNGDPNPNNTPFYPDQGSRPTSILQISSTLGRIGNELIRSRVITTTPPPDIPQETSHRSLLCIRDHRPNNRLQPVLWRLPRVLPLPRAGYSTPPFPIFPILPPNCPPRLRRNPLLWAHLGRWNSGQPNHLSN